MAYDLEEQEQIAVLKAWWKDHGNLVVAAVAAGALSLGAFQGWRYYQHSRALTAVVLYEQLEQAERAGDHKKVRDIAGQITGKYGATPYGAFAALSAARAGFDTGDLGGAKSQLQWVMDNAKETEVRDIARLRLAGVLLDEKNYAEALKLAEAKPVDSMAGLYADLRGDILLTQGRKAEARGAYQFALDKSEAGSPYRAAVQLKLDSLGEAAPAAK
ncbi:MAG: tetratricopeptide repeat protein [Betaproteobacteria bacterium]|nr:tetratricopeptide repeat protein [Betaproteobacteria bacterium]